MAVSSVQGLEALDRRLQRVPAEVRREVRIELEAGADRIVSLAKSLAPVEEGDLRASIEKVDGAHELQVLVVAGGPAAWHARIIEFGRKGAAASPFFFPAFRTLKRALASQISRAIGRAVKKAAGP